MKRNTAVRDRHRTVIARTHPPCALCGEDIDYTLPWYDPRAFVVDHILPLTLDGPDTLANKQAAHRSCNRDKGGKQHETVIKRSSSIVRPGGGPPHPTPSRPSGA